MRANNAQKDDSFKRVADNLYRHSNGRYYGLVRKKDKQIKQSLQTKDRQLAERRLKEFLGKANRLDTASEHRNLLFCDLADLWLKSVEPHQKERSFKRRQTSVRGILPFFKGVLVRNLGTVHLERWQQERIPQVSARTWNIDRETMKKILGYANNTLRIIPDNPAQDLKRLRQKKAMLLIPSRSQFETIIRELRFGHRATGHAAELIEFLAYSGMRHTEALSVQWADVDWGRKQVRVTGGEKGTKNHEERFVPLFPALEDLLRVMQARRPQPVNDKQPLFSIRSAREQLQRACERLGLPKFTHHDMRHFFCSNAIELNIDFKTIAAWLGHKDGGVLVASTYGHLRDEHSASMALRMKFRAAA